MGDGPEDPLLDIIAPDGSIARLHLRSCRRAGVDPQTILSAFLLTAQQWHGSRETLQEYGRLAAVHAEQATSPITGQEISSFFSDMEKKGFPARHHSSIFSTNYHPAYRVVMTDIWRQHESLHLSP